jgi:hypothetical protein
MVHGFPVALVLLALGASQGAPLGPSDFLAADAGTKGRALTQLVAREAKVPIANVITLVGLGMRDPSPLVRTAALAAISARATMARWAGTPGPQTGPGPGPRRELLVVPIEWKDDQRKLREALHDKCLILERMRETDPEDQVRTSAQLAIEAIQRGVARPVR